MSGYLDEQAEKCAAAVTVPRWLIRLLLRFGARRPPDEGDDGSPA